MFMVATEAWPDGINSKSDTTGEQLNTPRPEDVCGFENGSFGGLVPSDNKPSKVISKNHINNSNSITMMNEEDHNNNNNSSMYGSKKAQLFGFKTSPMTSPPSFTLDEAFSTVPYNSSWQFEPCQEEAMLSPGVSYLTPHQSPGVASPGSSSGAAEYRVSDEFETCVDFSKIIFTPNTEVVEGSTALSDEIEQLSESYYCKSNNLISVDNYTNDGDSSVSPSFLKVLQEQSTTVGDETPSSVASNSIVFETHPPSFATILQSDADNDDDDDDDEKPGKDAADAIAWTQEALQNVSSRDDTLDLKTQTQLEHNYYTIKLPLDEGIQGHSLTRRNTVKEEPLKPRETTLLQQPKRVQPSVKRQLFERKHSEMAASGPKLKLNVSTEVATIADPFGVLNTPDLTTQVLELEADVFSGEGKFDLLNYIDSFTDYDADPTSPVEQKPKILSPPEPAPAPPLSTICATTLSDLFNPAKRKLPMITIDNIDELTASTNRKKSRYAASSTTSSLCGDNASETSSTPRAQKRRGRPPKQDSSIRDRSEYQHLNEDDLRYREQRDKNNEASRRSRLNRRDREVRLEQEADELKRQFEELKGEERTLIQDCARWRKAVMRLALL